MAVNYDGAGAISFTVFPNPNNGKEQTWLKIENGQGVAAIDIAIYDMLGRTISFQSANLSGLSAYLLHLTGTQHLGTGIYGVTITDAKSGTIISRQHLIIE